MSRKTDLVPRSRFGGSRTKNRGRGEGKGEEETRSGKIRLRGPESGPRVNCACSKSDLFFVCAVQTLSSIPCCVLLLKTRFSKFKAKLQTFGCFEGCSAAGRYVLAVLPTGYGKNLTDLRAVAAKHFGNRNVSVCRGRRAGSISITIVVLPLSALMELQISCLKKSETGPLLFLLQCETRAKEKTKT